MDDVIENFLNEHRDDLIESFGEHNIPYCEELFQSSMVSQVTTMIIYGHDRYNIMVGNVLGNASDKSLPYSNILYNLKTSTNNISIRYMNMLRELVRDYNDKNEILGRIADDI